MCQHKDKGEMGFKDLTMFNEAMLAKFAWRLLHDDNYLFFHSFLPKMFHSRKQGVFFCFLHMEKYSQR